MSSVKYTKNLVYNEIVPKLMEILKIKKQTELAEMAGINYQALSNAKAANIFRYKWIIQLVDRGYLDEKYLIIFRKHADEPKNNKKSGFDQSNFQKSTEVEQLQRIPFIPSLRKDDRRTRLALRDAIYQMMGKDNSPEIVRDILSAGYVDVGTAIIRQFLINQGYLHPPP